MAQLSNPDLLVETVFVWLISFLGLSGNIYGYLANITVDVLPKQLAGLFSQGITRFFYGPRSTF